MDLNLAGTVAVVVGAARGLGKAIASAFAEEGARMLLVDCDAEVEAAARSIAGEAGDVQSVVADATDFQAVRATAAAARERFGRVDHIVYAAAVGSGKFG